MAISVYDVRDTFARPRPMLPSRRAAATATPHRRVPAAALLAGLLAIVQAIGLLAVALHALDGLLAAPSRPAGPVLALALLGLAGWIVLSAAGGAALIDGSGRRLLVGLAGVEAGLVVLLGTLAVVRPIALPAGLPLAGALLLAAVPAGKLLLAGAPAVREWVAAGPRPVEARPDPARTHRVLATATLGVIGLGLGAVALLGPGAQPQHTGEIASTTVYQP